MINFSDSPQHSKGLIPRNYSTHPKGMFPLAAITPLSDDAIQAAINRKNIDHSWLNDLRAIGYQGKPIPSRDQNGKGYCFPAGTRVRMADGTQKPIESIRLCEKVVTAEGNINRVMQCHVRDYSGELITIKLWGHSHLRLTPNHKVLTKRGYVESGKLTVEDWVCLPRYAPQASSILQTSDHVCGVRRKTFNTVTGSPYSDIVSGDGSTESIPDFIDLITTTGRIFGLWLAEGYTRNNELIWSFNSDETETLATELINLIKQEWNADAEIRQGPTASVTLVILKGKLWVQLFKALLGSLAGGKRIHADLMSGPKLFLEGMFWGWMAGDGYTKIGKSGKRYKNGCTISHDLALNMFDIANFLGLQPTINREKPETNKHAKVRQAPWKVQVNTNPSDYRSNYRYQAEENRVWRKVKTLNKEQFTGTVYNIGVENDHSYVAEGLSVSNCWAHSSTSAVLLCRCRDGQPYADLSAFAVACIIKNYRDQGGFAAQSADFIANRGIPTSDFWPQKSMNPENDNPKTWENAAFHKITLKFNDIQPNDIRTAATYLINDVPVTFDIDAWGHSVCGVRVKQWLPKPIFTIWNSWRDDWGTNGEGDVSGSYLPNDMVAIDSVLGTSQ